MLNSLFLDYVQTLDSALENTKQHWFEQADLEATKNSERRYQQGRGPCNIFILDTSSNMGEEGFIQMIDTFCSIMDEYARYPEMDENVAVVICGRTTTFKHYYSNNYDQIKHCIDDVEYGGPCPLTAAFILSLGAILKRSGHTRVMGSFHVHPRFIVISSGRPTDFTLMNNMEEIVMDHLHQTARKIGRHNPIYCIPVGKNPDMENLRFISALSRGGKIVYPHEARQFAKYTQNKCFERFDKETIIQLIPQAMPGKEFTDTDKEDIFEICTKRSLFIPMDQIEKEATNSGNNDSVIEWDPCMPPLGSRVRKSPESPLSTVERHIIGTVIEHCEDVGWLIVKWDGGSMDKYRYGLFNEQKYEYDVIVCDVPRMLENELIATGCLVYRGPDWEFGDQDGGEGSIGSVYSATPNGIVDVRWQNGTKNNYRFGFGGKFDLSLCNPFSAEANRFLQDQKRHTASKLPETMQYIYADVPSSETPRSGDEKILKTGKETNIGIFLKTPKGVYFKNDTVENDNDSDLDIDCSDVTCLSINCDHWLWKDKDGTWNHYSKRINDKLMKNFKRNQTSTVVITLQDDLYRVVFAKNMQINLMTREQMEIKLVKNEV
ncbi:uncharacterized protein LOC133178099 [Saccostrea echinata]|uniref:uncharacterized protein LOC133178099 n=1 Tax=Saccostrea echinata TaxID=191078 RepID=UPI002A833A6F|nr:uncharacterized protein LOC133178099 [Saccostrea echinata]